LPQETTLEREPLTSFKVGDTVYHVEVNNANLPHQADGIDLFRCEVINRYKRKYAITKELIYSVGKFSYSRKGVGGFSFLNVMFELGRSRIVFKKLIDAQKEMIREVFRKEKWLK
jgi:hypothetical protein